MVLGAVVLMLVAVSIPLAGLVRQLTVAGEAVAVIPVLVSAAVGVVVARHQPANPLGWLLLFFTLLLMLSLSGRNIPRPAKPILRAPRLG